MGTLLKRLRKHWKGTAIVVLLLWAAFVFILSDILIIGPHPGKIDAGAARQEVLSINGRHIDVWTARSSRLRSDERPAGYVLEFCGNTTRAENIAQYVAQRWHRWPVEVWVMNNPGQGASDGWMLLKNIAPDALGVYDEIHHRAGPAVPIFVEANSLGTNAALCVAARRPVAGCVLHDPVPLKKLIIGKYGWWNLWLVAGPVAWHVPSDLDSITNARQVRAPAVFILADQDDYIAPTYQQLVVDAYAGPSRRVTFHGGHWSSVEGETAKELETQLDWLWTQASQD